MTEMSEIVGGANIVEEFYGWYERSQQQAISADIPASDLDWLVLNFLNANKLALRLQQIKPSKEQLEQLDRLWQEHLEQNTPLQYLVGKLTWRDLALKVDRAVLIPRPETELLVDIALESVPQFAQQFTQQRSKSSPQQLQTWLDLGTGSGAIAIALALAMPNAQIHAVDDSKAALQVAIENAKRNLLAQSERSALAESSPPQKSTKPIQIANLQFHQGSWFEPIEQMKKQFTGIVSNPPYIPTAELASLQPEVIKHEPHLALDGGSDGLAAIQHLINTAPAYLIPGGFWAVELMAGQADMVRSLLLANGNYVDIKVYQDYAGIDRFVSARGI
ncbi:peptide chain release factor N(5)-glutamine methyltransferase [Thalassoporum mexicanum]|uniref:peptide chain release factor N(5)-glutamine methyltransferase n=1 Tax=Thalassoporum mexicanum TaxID=3457544 RepID=UPI0005A0AA12|nr:peptide chain release factor N(5)-glutamine methyltransferase [Pseudanabaena sp. PCC 7367]